ncbi:MAG: YdcF family protein [Acidimicrobiia bacterium]|nr:YdcF family protein [Actinomycetota bacterium]NDE81705.1 YdcF family protein [Actinomycetota bacterium]NDF31422.1 YdcF family protein [Acidimicrobiia bacterium]
MTIGSEDVDPMSDETPIRMSRLDSLRRRFVRPPRWWRAGGLRRVVGVVACLVLLAFTYLIVSLAQVWWTGRQHYSGRADAIVVMGAAQYDGRPSPQLQARLDQVLILWNEGVAPVIIVTGGNQPGDRFTEASTSSAYLQDHGVPESAILFEDTGRSSWESLQNVAEVADQHGIGSVILVSDPFHSLRIRLMAEELGLIAHTSSTRTSPVRGFNAFKHHVAEAGGVALGRVLGFERVESLLG